MQSRRIVAPFEGLNSSLAQLAGELWSCKVMVIKCLTWVLKENQPSSKGVKVRVCVSV